MISTFSFGQLVTIYSIIVLTSESFNCHESCGNALFSKTKVIFQTATHIYVSDQSNCIANIQSHSYHYSQFIRLNQSPPMISGTFKKSVVREKIDLNFPFTFYGADVRTFNKDSNGRTYFQEGEDTSFVFNHITDNVQCEVEILNGEEFLAVRKLCPIEIDNKSDTFKAMYLIHSNGKISFYYENIPSGLKEGDVLMVAKKKT
ncbi:unnamed protein product [Schistosoma curassoni]|nr:unnamed protein product [Schistosoma curassoni]